MWLSSRLAELPFFKAIAIIWKSDSEGLIYLRMVSASEFGEYPSQNILLCTVQKILEYCNTLTPAVSAIVGQVFKVCISRFAF